MNWIKNTLILLLINLSFSLHVFSQQNQDVIRTNDFWTGVSFKYKLKKRTTFSLGHEVRMMDNLNAIRSNLIELSVKRKINKYLYTKFQYRYTMRNNERHTNRYALDAIGKWNIKPAKLEFGYRARFQYSLVTFTDQPASFLRNRIQVRYKLSKKIKPYISYESFYKFDDDQEFRANRYTVGLTAKLNKELDLTLMYSYDQEINKKEPQLRNIVGLFVSYTF